MLPPPPERPNLALPPRSSPEPVLPPQHGAQGTIALGVELLVSGLARSSPMSPLMDMRDILTLPKGWVESPNKCFHCLQYYPGRCIVPVDKKGACMLCRMKKMTCTDSEPKSKKKNPGDKKKDSQPKAGPSTEKGKKPEEGSKAGPSMDKGKKPEEPPKAGLSKRQETKGTSKTPGSQVSSSKPGIYVLMPTVPKHGDAIIANQVCLGHRWIWATTNQLLATSSRHRRPD